MAQTGRNAPCPCGSGKKYKKCCLSQDRERRRQDQLEADAAGQALTWLDEHHGEAVEEAFREEFLGSFDDEELAKFAELSEGLLSMVDINGREFVLAQGHVKLAEGPKRCLDLVLGPGGPLLDAVQRTYLEKLGERSLSLYEIVESQPGEGFRLRDLVDEDEPLRWVAERAGSQGPAASEGSVLAARLMPGSPWRLSGAIYPIPEADVLPVLQELRDELGRESRSPAAERDVRGTIVVDTWLSLLTMPPPTLVDASTGEAALFVTDHYRVIDWDRLEAAFAGEPDVEGDRQDGWTRFEDLGNEVRRSRLAINLGKRNRIEAFARTQTMADEGRTWLQKVAGDAIDWMTREISDPMSLWDRRNDDPPEPSAPALEPSDLPADFHQQIYEQIYRDWADKPIPGLGNQAPRQAVRTPQGRRKVVDLLESYERGEKGKARQEGRPEVTFDFLWQSIGLEREPR